MNRLWPAWQNTPSNSVLFQGVFFAKKHLLNLLAQFLESPEKELRFYHTSTVITCYITDYSTYGYQIIRSYGSCWVNVDIWVPVRLTVYPRICGVPPVFSVLKLQKKIPEKHDKNNDKHWFYQKIWYYFVIYIYSYILHFWTNHDKPYVHTCSTISR